MMVQKSSVTHVQEKLNQTARPDALNSAQEVSFLTALMVQMYSVMHVKRLKQNARPDVQNSAVVVSFSTVLMAQMYSAMHAKNQKQNVKPNALK